MTTIHDRIKERRLAKGLSMEALASQLGLKSWQTVQQWENGKTAPHRKRLPDVARELDTTVEYLNQGIGPDATEEHAPVRLIDAKASAGAGRVVFSEDTLKTLMFRRDWLGRHGITDEKYAACFEVDGQSMVDAGIPDGSVVITNLRETDPHPKKIYLVHTEYGLIVKQLVHEGGRWIARSRNEADKARYPDLLVGPEARVLGRAFWCAFEL